MQTAQYWKPGEKKPRDGGSGRRDGDGRTATAVKGNNGERRRDGAEQHSTKSSNGGSAKKRGKMSKGKDKESNSSSSSSSAIGGIDAEVSRSAAKPPVAGPSQGLLAMKFMQRKMKADEVQKQQQEKRDKLESDFSSSYAKRLKADKTNDENNRLICRLDEQDPALVVVGRRSFGGFNAVAEAAYDACVRDIAAGERLGQLGREGRGGGGGGISDTEMAETLGKNVRDRGRR